MAMTCSATRTKIARCDLDELYDMVLPLFEENEWRHTVVEEENRIISSRLVEVWTSGTEIIEVTFKAEIIWAERESGVYELLITVSDVSNKWTLAQCEEKVEELLANINSWFAARWHPYRNLISPAQIQQTS
jgi:hypothetical protein